MRIPDWATMSCTCLSLLACGRTSQHEPAADSGADGGAGTTGPDSSSGTGGSPAATSTDASGTSADLDSTTGGSSGGAGTSGASGASGAAGASSESCTTDPDPTEENEVITCCDGVVCRGACYEGTCWCEHPYISPGCEAGFFCCPVALPACGPLGSRCGAGPG
jgi:hypothetical protein